MRLKLNVPSRQWEHFPVESRGDLSAVDAGELEERLERFPVVDEGRLAGRCIAFHFAPYGTALDRPGSGGILSVGASLVLPIRCSSFPCFASPSARARIACVENRHGPAASREDHDK